MKRCAKVRLIRTCEEGLDADGAPGVCARDIGQTIMASKQAGGRMLFMWPVLTEIVCILHPAGGKEKLRNNGLDLSGFGSWVFLKGDRLPFTIFRVKSLPYLNPMG
jgi:hypothetical protein